MRTHHFFTAVLAVGALTQFSAAGALAQTDHQQGTQKPMQHDMAKMEKMDMSGMMGEPHHLLAMAYMEALGTFAKALNTQAGGSGPLDAKVARSTVAEIGRCLDRMDEQREAHMKAMKMTDEMRSQMAPMMKDMDTHRSMMDAAVDALEKDVKGDQPDAKQVAAHSADILKHLADMAKMHDAK